MRNIYRTVLMGIFASLVITGCGGGGGGGGDGGTTNNVGGGAVDSTGNTGQGSTNTSLVPGNARYDATISGTTYFGNTSFPAAQTTYTPTINFSLSGILIVEPTRDRSGANFDNGINPRDIGLFIGNPPGQPQAGSIWFVTNSQVSCDVGIGNMAQGLAQIDVAFVALDEQAGTLSIRADDRFVGTPVTRSNQLNVFNRISAWSNSICFSNTCGEYATPFFECWSSSKWLFRFCRQRTYRAGHQSYSSRNIRKSSAINRHAPALDTKSRVPVGFVEQID